MSNLGILSRYADLSFFSVSVNIGIDQAALERQAAEWIVQNKKKYIVNSGKSCFENLEKLIKDKSPYFYDALVDFSENFISNPYIYENGLNEQDSETLICSKSISCYMVKCNEVIVPLGVLEGLLEKNTYENIVKEFFEFYYPGYVSILKKDSLFCDGHLNRKREMSAVTTVIKTIICAFILLFSVSSLFDKLVLGIEWQDIGYVYKSCGSVLKTIGFLAELGFGINHNSYLIYIYLVAYILCIFIVPFAFINLIRGLKKLAVHLKRQFHFLTAKAAKSGLENLSRKCEVFISSLSMNGSLDGIGNAKIIRRENFLLRSFLKKLEKSNPPQSIPVSRYPLPSFTKAIVIFLIVFAVSKFSAMSENPQFIDKCNNLQQKISILLDETKTYAFTKYSVREAKRVFTLPDINSIELYTLPVGSTYTILQENENAAQIRFLTEYGYLSGWILEPTHSPYSLDNDTSISQAIVSEISVSSSGKGSSADIGDGRPSTFWSAAGENNGIGEYFESTFPQETPIAAIMLQSKRNYVLQTLFPYPSPSAFTLEFYKEDKLVKRLSFEVEETSKEQYIHINKAITADRLRVIIDGIFTQSDKNAYISEFAVFSPSVQ